MTGYDSQDILALITPIQKTIDKILDNCRSAKNWGVWDLFGGGVFSSMMKRDKIKKMEEQLDLLKYQVNKLNHALSDTPLQTAFNLPNSGYDFAFDVWFDNIFTDLKVQSELKELEKTVMCLSERLEELTVHLLEGGTK